MIEYVLFDLDNTLYPSSTGLGDEMNKRMTLFVAEHLGLDPPAAERVRREARTRYGTTLAWLREEHGLHDVEPYMEAVHPADLSPWITKQHAAEAQEVLEQIDVPAAILTNGPREHAERVLKRLGISDRFERMFDLRSNGFRGKPERSAYTKAISALAIRPESTLYVDDMLQYLLPFRDLGGRVVHMTSSDSAAAEIPTIRRLRDLVPIIYPDRSRR